MYIRKILGSGPNSTNNNANSDQNSNVRRNSSSSGSINQSTTKVPSSSLEGTRKVTNDSSVSDTNMGVPSEDDDESCMICIRNLDTGGLEYVDLQEMAKGDAVNAFEALSNDGRSTPESSSPILKPVTPPIIKPASASSSKHVSTPAVVEADPIELPRLNFVQRLGLNMIVALLSRHIMMVQYRAFYKIKLASVQPKAPTPVSTSTASTLTEPVENKDASKTPELNAHGVKLKDHEEYGPFMRMLAVNVPRGAIELKMQQKGLDTKYLDMDPETIMEVENLSKEVAINAVDKVKLKDDDTYGPYFKMLSVNVPRGAIELKMKQNGLDVSYLDMDPDTLIDIKKPDEESGSSNQVKLRDDERYGPFLKMLAVNVPRGAIELKMQQKGLDVKYLDMDPETLIDVEAPKSDEDGGGKVKLKDDERYGPFLKMLAVNVPRGAVELKMQQKGLDVKYLDMDPETLIDVEAPKSDGTEGKLVKLKDDERYGPFLKMLAVNVPRGAVELKMQQKGLDVKYLDMDPETLIDVEAPKSEDTGGKKVKLKDDERYGPFLKMLAVHVPRGAVELKMKQKNLDTTYLDMDPETLIDAEEPKSDVAEKKQIKLKDDERYAPFFKMLAVNVPRGAIELKMKQKNLDTKYLDMDPETLIDAEEAKSGEAKKKQIKLKDDERYAPFFKMLAVNVPRGAIELKMKQKKLDPKFLDMDPETMIDMEENQTPSKKIKLKDDERYGPFLKMLSVNVPRGAVEMKMKQKGLDVKYLEMDPETLIDVEICNKEPPKMIKLKNDERYAPFFTMKAQRMPRGEIETQMKAKGLDPRMLDKDPNTTMIEASQRPTVVTKMETPKPVPKPDKIQRRKFHWKKLRDQDLDKYPDAIWHSGERFMFEQQEIRDLEKMFTLNLTEIERQKEKSPALAKPKPPKSPVKVEKTMILETQRSNNVSIMLSGMMKSIDMDEAWKMMAGFYYDDEAVPLEDLKTILGLLPTPEEEKVLKEFTGDRSTVGKAEEYFFKLMTIPRYRQRINCLRFRLRYDEYYHEAKHDLETLSDACTDILKKDSKFKPFMSIVLALGNQLNEGENPNPKTRASGFMLEALHKLRGVKSFEGSTTALHFLARVIQTRRRDIISFIKSGTESMRNARNVSLANTLAHVTALDNGSRVLKMEHNVVARMIADEAQRENMSEEDKMFALNLNSFYALTGEQLDELKELCTKTEELFKKVLAYLCEDPSTTSERFFRDLLAFFEDFERALNENDSERRKHLQRQRERLEQQPKK